MAATKNQKRRRSGKGRTWAGVDGDLAEEARGWNTEHDRVYAASPSRITTDFRREAQIYEGGYHDRQVFELVQNAADAAALGVGDGRIELRVTDTHLYCANTGEPMTTEGLRALQFGDLSPKVEQDVELIGRFGVGFRSLLALANEASFFSRSGSFTFDRSRSRKRIKALVPDARETPAMNYAFPTDFEEVVTNDGAVEELSVWADSIVRVPLKKSKVESLEQALLEFPAEFLLFAGHITELRIKACGNHRLVKASTEGGITTIREGRRSTRWAVSRRRLRLSPSAIADGGQAYRDMDLVPVDWATPLDGAVDGRAWFFFPTDIPLSLSGILNAPWKTTQDRTSLVKGQYNNELLQGAAELVAESLPRLAEMVSEPGLVADLIPPSPRRYQYGSGWVERQLSRAIYSELETVKAFADVDGALRAASGLKLVDDEVHRKTLELWTTAPDAGTGFAHMSYMTGDRMERLESLESEPVADWLTAGLTDGDVDASIHALHVVIDHELRGENGKRSRKNPRETNLRRCAVVMVQAGSRRAPTDAELRLTAPAESPALASVVVHPAVAADRECTDYLRAVGVVDVVSTADQVVPMAKAIRASKDRAAWEELWTVIDEAGFDNVARPIARAIGRDLRVRCMDGEFRTTYQALWPGGIVSADGSDGSSVTFDESRHAAHEPMLRDHFKLTSVPMLGYGSNAEATFVEYRRTARSAYSQQLRRKGSKVDLSLIDVRRVPQWAGPLDPILGMNEEAAARFSLAVMEADLHPAEASVLHTRRPNQFAHMSLLGVAVWELRRHGRLASSAGVVPLVRLLPRSKYGRTHSSSDRSLSRRQSNLADVTGQFGGLDRLLPLTEGGPPPEFVFGTYDNEPDEWHIDFSLQFDPSSHEMDQLLSLFAEVHARDEDAVPANLPVLRDGSWMMQQSEWAEVTAYPELHRDSDNEWLLPIETASVRDWLVDVCGAGSLDDDVTEKTVLIPMGGDSDLGDLLPGLEDRLSDEISSLRTTHCLEMGLDISSPSMSAFRSRYAILEDGRLYLAMSEDGSETAEALQRILALDIPVAEIEQALRGGWESEQLLKRMAEAAERDTVEEKLVALLGSPEVAEIISLPVASLTNTPDDYLLGRALLALHGSGVLRILDYLLPSGAPKRWYGNPKAVDFVRRAGLPLIFAGSPSSDRPALEYVDGPPHLAPLHNYQREITDRIPAVIEDSSRAMISLPTGSGKTRVAVQGLLEALDDRSEWLVLWVAQSDELCEQAAETWRHLWQAIGAQQRFTISRLWAGNEFARREGPQVVVASIQKLDALLRRASGDLGFQPDVVVVDEAHRSITSSYTRVLGELGLDRKSTKIPMLGLTATPFRGIDHDETRRLVGRYGAARLDDGIFSGDPLDDLRAAGVLAFADHQVVDSGYEIDLDDGAIVHFETFGVLPPYLEGRMGGDLNRVACIAESILDLPSDWPTLVYCPSVDGAGLLAVVLATEGVEARVLSGETPAAARRTTIDQFRSGEVQILTNYKLLAEGLDAPSARAVVIARPVFSPNLYQQMIGRGLRGPKNGGTEECLIVDIADNLGRFEGDLAFHHFDYLWNR
jgi:superfamily II DNA or RNA helicase